MTNSADNLHALFSRWRNRVLDSPGATMWALLDIDGGGILEVSGAFAWMHVIEDELRYLGDRNFKVAVHQRNLKKWMRVPLMLTTGWRSGVTNADNVVDEDTLDQIESLSSFLDGKVLSSDDYRVPSLKNLISQAEDLLSADSTIEPALASYIRRLIAQIRDALQAEDEGSAFDFTAAVEKLRFAFQAAAETSETEGEKANWRAMAKQVVVGTSTALAIEIGKKALGLEA
ncbi:hypothetical protein [Microbacterium sp. 16-032]|uniref:hypothetical protein n=1 Tax=Microbacterium sp. 16-032 TaxID=3239808 RepID=UPI0034E2B307